MLTLYGYLIVLAILLMDHYFIIIYNPILIWRGIHGTLVYLEEGGLPRMIILDCQLVHRILGKID